MLNIENKTYELKKFSQSCFVDFCTKEIAYFAHWIFNKQLKNFGYQAFNEYSVD